MLYTYTQSISINETGHQGQCNIKRIKWIKNLKSNVTPCFNFNKPASQIQKNAFEPWHTTDGFSREKSLLL